MILKTELHIDYHHRIADEAIKTSMDAADEVGAPSKAN